MRRHLHLEIDVMARYSMKDGGKHQSFGKGRAVRDTADDKPRPDLISPFAEERQGEWLEWEPRSTPNGTGNKGCRSRVALPP